MAFGAKLSERNSEKLKQRIYDMLVDHKAAPKNAKAAAARIYLAVEAQVEEALVFRGGIPQANEMAEKFAAAHKSATELIEDLQTLSEADDSWLRASMIYSPRKEFSFDRFKRDLEALAKVFEMEGNPKKATRRRPTYDYGYLALKSACEEWRDLFGAPPPTYGTREQLSPLLECVREIAGSLCNDPSILVQFSNHTFRRARSSVIPAKGEK